MELTPALESLQKYNITARNIGNNIELIANRDIKLPLLRWDGSSDWWSNFKIDGFDYDVSVWLPGDGTRRVDISEYGKFFSWLTVHDCEWSKKPNLRCSKKK